MVTTCFMLRVHGKTNDTHGRHQPACDNFTYQLPNRLKKKIEAINIKWNRASQISYFPTLFSTRLFLWELRNSLIFLWKN